MKLSHIANKEWGSKARKREERQSNLTHTDTHRAIQEELAAIADQRATEQAETAKEAAEWAEFDRQWREDHWVEVEPDWTLEIDGYADMADVYDDIYAGTGQDY